MIKNNKNTKSHPNQRSGQVTPYLMLLPAIICLCVLLVYPGLRAVWMSFFDIQLLKPDVKFVGLQNYIKMLTDGESLVTVYNTILFALGSVAISTVLSMYIANLLNRPYRGRGLFRTIILIPWITPPVVATAVWKVILNESLSPINGLLMSLKMISKPISFLGNVNWGVGPFNIPMFMLVFVNVWAISPFLIVQFLAAMQNVPSDLYEAAAIAGANKRVQFFKITLPMIKPVVLVSVLLEFIWQFNEFSVGYLLTKGGPVGKTRLLAVEVYQQGFSHFNYSKAATLSVVMCLMILIPAIFYIKKTIKDEGSLSE